MPDNPGLVSKSRAGGRFNLELTNLWGIGQLRPAAGLLVLAVPASVRPQVTASSPVPVWCCSPARVADLPAPRGTKIWLLPCRTKASSCGCITPRALLALCLCSGLREPFLLSTHRGSVLQHVWVLSVSFFRVFTVWGYRSGAVSSCCRLLDISLCLSLVQPFFHRLSTRSPAYLPRCCFALYQRTQGSFPKLILNTFRTLGEGKKKLKLAPTQVLGTTFRQRALKMHLTVQIAKTQTAGVTCVHSAHAPCVSCAVVGCCPVRVVFPRLPLVHLPGTELSGVSQAALKRRALLACSPAEKCCALQLCTGFKGCDLVCKSELIPARGRASSWLCWDKEGLAFAFRGERGFQAARKVGGGNPLRCYLLWFCLEC